MTHSNEKNATLESALAGIVAALKASDTGSTCSQKWLAGYIRSLNEGVRDVAHHVKKKQLLPYYLEHASDFALKTTVEHELIALLRAKPMRSASGVATITVLTKPWPCAGACAFCPNDLSMPKSYLAKEPACQRALQNYFDPYLQVASRLLMLWSMGHPTDKIELIVLGGTFTDYPLEYRRWFVAEAFRALNDGVDGARAELAMRKRAYAEAGAGREVPRAFSSLQSQVDAGKMSYNEAVRKLERPCPYTESATLSEVVARQRVNEDATSRCVGLSFETRPNACSPAELAELRALGATKIQIGVQSTLDELLEQSGRTAHQASIWSAFATLRRFGFKIQAHFMVNLPGRNLTQEIADYQRFVSDPHYLPDEIKLYPTSLIGGTALEREWLATNYRPYTSAELISVLAEDLLATPPYVRVSRVIRDFSASDIVAGNKLGNLRQMVEAAIAERGEKLVEIRSREVGLHAGDPHQATMCDYTYQTSVSEEHFLQFVDDAGRLHGFLRLSLPVGAHHAMIRELHIYGRVTSLGESGEASQHQGLGTRLLLEAERIARAAHRRSLFVISAVGTRRYYEARGFLRARNYQVKAL